MRTLAPLLVLGLLGCGKSCRNDHPYVPYAIGDAAAPEAGAEDAGAAVVPEDASTPLAVGVAAPPGATRWPLDGLDLEAPPGRVFVAGLVADLDGDGARDAAALVRRAGASAGGELVVYRGGRAGLEAPAVVGTAPFAAPEPTCTAKDRLSRIGRRSVAAELGVECTGPAGGVRWLAVVALAPHAAPRVSLELSIADPASAPHLGVTAEGADRDGDGIDDVTLRVALDAPTAPFEPAPPVSATVAWLDRPAGESRVPDEPEASLRALVQPLAAKAARAKDAPSVAPAVHQVRALYSAMCAEGGAPRLVRPRGGEGAIACGASRALEDAGLALARAHVTLGDPARAAWALERAQLPPATRNVARAAEVHTLLAQAFPPVVAPRPLRAIAAVPAQERAAVPAWGPLAFEAGGKLLVRTTAGVVRVDPATGEEVEASDVKAWSSQVTSPDGARRWLEAYAGCDRVALRASFSAGAETRELLLPIEAPMGGRCVSGKGEPARAFALAWGARGLEAIVGGEAVLISPDLSRAAVASASLEEPGPPGSPRSPGGKVTVLPTPGGIVVRAQKVRVLRAKELEGGYLELQACVVSDDAAQVACLRGGRAFVGVWDAP